MHSEGINAGEMKHGPLALVDDKLPIVVVSTMDTMHSKMAGVIQQVRCVRLLLLCFACCCCCVVRWDSWLAWLAAVPTCLCLSNRPSAVCPLPVQPNLTNQPLAFLLQLMARNGRLIVIANEEDDEMVDIVNGKYPIIQVG